MTKAHEPAKGKGEDRSPPECDECSKPATHYEKDQAPMRRYCGRHAAKWARKGVQIRALALPLRPPADVPECTVETTPEEWSLAHTTVTGHQDVNVIPWGAICACGALWTRDPEKGGPDRRRKAGAS